MENNYFTDIYDFHWLVRVKEHEDRTVRYMKKQNDRKRRKLREPLDIGEKVLVIAERLKKEMHQAFCIRSPPETNHFSIEMKFLGVGINSGEINCY